MIEKAVILFIVLALIFVSFVGWACCAAASRADDEMERALRADLKKAGDDDASS